jgi:uncharacterized protein
MAGTYHNGHRLFQDRFDTSRLADRIDERLVDDVIDSDDKAFIEDLDMFFLATSDEQGHPNCSYKGGEPGFVRVLDDHTLAFPNYDGNGMYLSAGNVLVNPNVGMLFIDFEKGRRLRLNGVASIDENDELMEHYPEAQFVVRVERARSSRTAHVTSTSTVWWNALSSCPRLAARRRCPTGNGRHGPRTSYLPTIRHEAELDLLGLSYSGLQRGQTSR